MLAHLIDQIQTARAERRALSIVGRETKAFYGGPREPAHQRLSTAALQGITSYQPSELVVTAMAGTPLAELEAALADKGQCLAFEPPHFGAPGALGGTVGGMVAAGLSGPARASQGSVRDHVLGATLLNGRGEVLHLGGQMIKNVAGYDVSRLLVGSLGVLGVIASVSLKVMPQAPASASLRLDCSQSEALDALQRWGGQALPLNASLWQGADGDASDRGGRAGQLTLRLRGAQAAVQSACERLQREGLRGVDEAEALGLWQAVRHQRCGYFERAREAVSQGQTLWRLSVPAGAPVLDLPAEGGPLIEWQGAQRWWFGALPASTVRAAAAAAGGHATLFDGRDKSAGVMTPLDAPLARIHRQLKQAFDPEGVFNPGRLYPDW